MDEKTVARFWAKVDKSGGPDACWLWTGGIGGTGYGAIKVGDSIARAHRVSWELANGPIQNVDGFHGTCVCHRCDVRHCVNPAHLFLGTHTDNMADKIAKGRANGLRGETNAYAKLTEYDARCIIEMLHEKGLTHRAIAARFGVTASCVGGISTGRTWAHLPRA